MKLTIKTADNKTKGSIELPEQFNEPVRTDIIKRAVLAIQSRKRQPYGADPEAGKRASAYVSKRRHSYKSTYGIGQSRTPRKVMSFRGSRFNWVGAFAPQTVGGRRAHPPKASKIWELLINKKERRKAIRSAMAATIIKEIVKERGHKIPEDYPFAIADELQEINKTNELIKALVNLGFKEELERAAEKKIRAGKGKRRGRKYKTKKSLLIVTSKECPLIKAAENITGIEAVTAEELNAELLAPGTMPGRATLYTESAIKKIKEEQLFMNKRTNITKKVNEKETTTKTTTKTTKKGDDQ